MLFFVQKNLKHPLRGKIAAIRRFSKGVALITKRQNNPPPMGRAQSVHFFFSLRRAMLSKAKQHARYTKTNATTEIAIHTILAASWEHSVFCSHPTCSRVTQKGWNFFVQSCCTQDMGIPHFYKARPFGKFTYPDF